jgi:hypothetical protein
MDGVVLCSTIAFKSGTVVMLRLESSNGVYANMPFVCEVSMGASWYCQITYSVLCALRGYRSPLPYVQRHLLLPPRASLLSSHILLPLSNIHADVPLPPIVPHPVPLPP